MASTENPPVVSDTPKSSAEYMRLSQVALIESTQPMSALFRDQVLAERARLVGVAQAYAQLATAAAIREAYEPIVLGGVPA